MDRLALICEAIASTSSRAEKVEILAGYLSTLDDRNLRRAIRFLTGDPVADAPRDRNLFGFDEAPKLALGHSTIRKALVEASSWDEETVRHCYREVGDSGETVGHLMDGKTRGEAFSLESAEAVFFRLQREQQAQKRHVVLLDLFSRLQPLTLKYFIKSVSGNFRIGLQQKMLEEALAEATGHTPAELRAAMNLTGDLADAADAARKRRLDQLQPRLFHPMDFMLAKALPDPIPPETLDELAAQSWFVEDKYDGIRVQLHAAAGRAEIYTRNLECVSNAFPEVIEASLRMTEAVILDGEILAWKDGRALSFAALQQRVGRKSVTRSLMTEVPVAFMSYDILFHNDVLMWNTPIEIRRSILETAVNATPLLLAPQSKLASPLAIEALYQEARHRGNEGLVLKQAASLYLAAKRTDAWLKVKKVFATLDVVVTAAEQGHGKRASVLSDYSFAVLDQNQYVNVGKAYSGLTDQEIRELTRVFRSSAIGKYGRALQVEPRVVLEVGFDGIQRSNRHKSGFALRFPRILRWRTDKGPTDCDTLERVRELYDSQLNLTANRMRDE